MRPVCAPADHRIDPASPRAPAMQRLTVAGL
jgi:hypothetical protein